MKTAKSDGVILTLTAPGGGVTAGTPVKIGQMVVIPLATVAATLAFAAMITGVVNVPKKSADVWAEGELVYWHAGNAEFQEGPTVAQTNGPMGIVESVAGAATTVGDIYLFGVAAVVDA